MAVGVLGAVDMTFDGFRGLVVEFSSVDKVWWVCSLLWLVVYLE